MLTAEQGGDDKLAEKTERIMFFHAGNSRTKTHAKGAWPVQTHGEYFTFLQPAADTDSKGVLFRMVVKIGQYLPDIAERCTNLDLSPQLDHIISGGTDTILGKQIMNYIKTMCLNSIVEHLPVTIEEIIFIRMNWHIIASSKCLVLP